MITNIQIFTKIPFLRTKINVNNYPIYKYSLMIKVYDKLYKCIINNKNLKEFPGIFTGRRI